MSKGHKQRPLAISQTEWNTNYDAIFGRKPVTEIKIPSYVTITDGDVKCRGMAGRCNWEQFELDRVYTASCTFCQATATGKIND